MKQQKKITKQNGITLISLIITIVVMLILAGVAISITVEPDGLFGKAREAEEKWNAGVENEEEKAKEALAHLGIYFGSSDDWEVEGTTIVAYKGDKTTYTDIVIPGYVDGVAVDTIGRLLFASDQYATSLKISEGIKVIGNAAFAGCSNIKGELEIPSTVTTLEQNAFTSCGFTGDLLIPDNVTSIGYAAFASNHGITGTLIIGKNVNTIEDNAFADCRFKSIVMGENVQTIGNSAFSACQNMSGHLTLPNSVRTIKTNAFAFKSDSFESITVPNTVTTVEDGAFATIKTINYSGTLDTTNWK